MRHITFILIGALLAGISMSSCSSPEPLDNVVFATAPEMFNYVCETTRADGSGQCSEAGYSIVFDDDARTCNITISNLCLGSSEPMILQFDDVAWTYPSKQRGKSRVIEADRLEGYLLDGSNVVLTNVLMIYTQTNEFDVYGCSGMYARYTVNGLYSVMAYPYAIFGEGTTVIHTDESTSDFIDYDAVYRLQLNPAGNTASLQIDNLDFAGEMRNVDITGIRLQLTDAGYDLALGPDTSIDGIAGSVAVVNLRANADMREELKIYINVEVNDVAYELTAYLTPNLTLPASE